MAQQIILADAQVVFRTGAARVLCAEDDLNVAVQCGDVDGLEEALVGLPGSIAVFPSNVSADLAYVLDRIEQAGAKSVIIVEHGASLNAGISARADGVLPRSVAGPQLIECLRRVALGERCVQDTDVEVIQVKDGEGRRLLEQLAPKELQIIALASAGGKNKEIALRLGTTEQVVKNYLRSIYEKTGVSDRLELALFTQHHRALADAAKRVRQQLQFKV